LRGGTPKQTSLRGQSPKQPSNVIANPQGEAIQRFSLDCFASLAMTRHAFLTAFLATTFLLTSCYVKDPIYEPASGMGGLTLTTNWTQRSAGVDAPASYRAEMGGYSETLTGETNTLDHLFDEGAYRLYVWNPADEITVSGTTATVGAATGNVDGIGPFVHNAPGWFFSRAMDVTITGDRTQAVTAVMRQQVRRLTVRLAPDAAAEGQIAAAEGYLSGVAGTLDIDSDTHGAPSNVELAFTEITTGPDAGKWTATVRLLGIAGDGQSFGATIRFADGSTATLTSDLTADMDGFNTDKIQPLELTAAVHITRTEAGFTVDIHDWAAVLGGSVIAERD